jgi:hypothetical protein
VPSRDRPLGTITRGTTNPNRLRRCDRWIASPQAWRLRRSHTPPVVVDLCYDASPVTAVELHDRLRRVRSDVQVVGVEIDPARVRDATPLERDGSLIHRNVPGEPVHAFLTDRDRAWERSAASASWGARQRFLARSSTSAEPGRCSTARPAGGSER